MSWTYLEVGEIGKVQGAMEAKYFQVRNKLWIDDAKIVPIQIRSGNLI